MVDEKNYSESLKAATQGGMNPKVYTDNGLMYGYEQHPKGKEFLEYYMSLGPLKKFISSVSEMSDNPNILDLGSGKGLESNEFKQILPSAKITSVDISNAGTRSGRVNFGLDQVQGDVNAPPFPNEQFEGIHCKDVLVHVPDKKVFLENISRILKPNGVFIVVSAEDVYEGFKQYKWSSEELIAEAKNFGLELASQEKIEMAVEDWYSYKSTRNFLLFKKTSVTSDIKEG